MYVAYLFNIEGRYQAPVYLDDEQSVIYFVFRYKDIAPRIMVTQNDLSAFEVENGVIVFPELDSESIAKLTKQIVPMGKDATVDSLLSLYKQRVEAFECSLGKDKDAYQSMVQIESDMFAIAASQNINLALYGWESSGVIEARLDACYD